MLHCIFLHPFLYVATFFWFNFPFNVVMLRHKNNLVRVYEKVMFCLKIQILSQQTWLEMSRGLLKIFSGFTLTNIETVSNCSHWLGSLLTFCHSATIPSASWYEQSYNVNMTHTSRHENMVTKPMTRTNVNLTVVRRNINCQHFILATGQAKTLFKTLFQPKCKTKRYYDKHDLFLTLHLTGL